MAADKPVSLSRLVAVFAKEKQPPGSNEISKAIEEIERDYDGRGIEIKRVAGGFRIQTRNDYAGWINRLFSERSPRYSRALLETLAIIAYRQPVTRGEIEEIRGISANSGVIHTLQERGWIRVVGHKESPGQPELLATSKDFLDYFNLKKLSDLPPLAGKKDFDRISPDLFEQLENKPCADDPHTGVQAEREGQSSVYGGDGPSIGDQPL